MLFWIFVIVLVLSTGIMYFIYKAPSYEDWHEQVTIIFSILAGVAVTAIIISLVIFGCSYIPASATKSGLAEEYRILNYQIQTQMYNNDNEYGKQELMSAVKEWNKGVTYYQTTQRNFWIGIYIPNIYDDFKLIDYQNYS